MIFLIEDERKEQVKVSPWRDEAWIWLVESVGLSLNVKLKRLKAGAMK